MAEISPLFIANARAAIKDMQAFQMPDAAIAGVLCDIRAAAIHEERLRVDVLTQKNPPQFPTWVQMRDAAVTTADAQDKRTE